MFCDFQKVLKMSNFFITVVKLLPERFVLCFRNICSYILLEFVFMRYIIVLSSVYAFAAYRACLALKIYKIKKASEVLQITILDKAFVERR